MADFTGQPSGPSTGSGPRRADGGASPQGASAAAGGPLGKTYELTCTAVATEEGSCSHENACTENGCKGRDLRYRRQRVAARLLPDDRVSRCFWSMVGPWVTGKYHEKQRRAFFSGLVVCGSVWTCPVCAARIAEGRRQEVEAALAAATAMGLRAVPVTRTIRHARGDGLPELLEAFQKARGAMRSGKFRAALWRDFGIAGTITALEVTHGASGWHVHDHSIVLVRADADVGAMERRMLAEWKKCVVRAGLEPVTDRGLLVERRKQPDAAYLCKVNKAAAVELTKAVTKLGRAGNRNPLQLLDAYADGDKQAGALWVAYAEAFASRRQLSWSRGLRALLLPGGEFVPDEVLAADEPVSARAVVELLPEHWRSVQAVDARSAVLRAIEAGEEEGGVGALVTVGALLERLGCRQPLLPVGQASGASQVAALREEWKPARWSEVAELEPIKLPPRPTPPKCPRCSCYHEGPCDTRWSWSGAALPAGGLPRV